MSESNFHLILFQTNSGLEIICKYVGCRYVSWCQFHHQHWDFQLSLMIGDPERGEQGEPEHPGIDRTCRDQEYPYMVSKSFLHKLMVYLIVRLTDRY